MDNQTTDEFYAAKIQNVKGIRELAQHYLLPEKPATPAEQGSPEFNKKMALATGAVEVVCSIVNLFGVMRKNRMYSPESVIPDLVFALNTNVFWLANASYLMPILNASVNAINDNASLKLKGDASWGPLEYHNNNVWLELLPAVLFCIKGYPVMREKSLEMKQAFGKFING
jgi:hypothetical protein